MGLPGGSTGTEILRCGISSARRPDFIAGIFPLRGPTSQLLDGMCPRSEANTSPTPLWGFCPLGGPIIAGIFPTRRRDLQVPQWDKQLLGNYTPNQAPNILESKQIFPRRHLIPNKIITRQSKQDLNKHFHLKSYCFYCKNSQLHPFKYILGYIWQEYEV